MPEVPRVPILLVAVVLLGGCATQAPAVATIHTDGPAVLIATIEARCDRCAWDVEGREAVMFRVLLDGHYSSHLPLVRTEEAGVQTVEYFDEMIRRKIVIQYAGDAKFKGVRSSFPVYDVDSES